MNFVILIFLSIFLPTISLKQIKPKLCINCKHFISDNLDTDNGLYVKCSLFPKKEGIINFLVTGINKDENFYCSTVRGDNSMCGEEGKHYKKKRVKNIPIT